MPASSIHQTPSVRTTLIGAACLSLQPLALNAISVPVLGYIIRRLGPDGYAQWTVAVSLLSVCAILANLGLRTAFLRSVSAQPASAGTALAGQLGLRLPLAVLVGAMVVGICIAMGYPPPVVWCAAVGAVGLVLTTLASTLSDLLQAFHRMPTLAGVNTVAGLTLTALSVVVAWAGGGPVAMAAAYLTGPAMSAAMLIAIVRQRICPVTVRWDPRRAATLLVRSRHFAAQQLLFVGSAQAEALILPRLIGLGQFGFFSAGSMPANRLGVLPDALCAAAYPSMVKACLPGPRKGAGLVLLYVLVGVLGGIVVAVVGTVLAEPIGRLVLPGQPALFAFAVRVTIWSVPLSALELVTGYALNAARREAVQARLAIPAAALSLLISVLLVSAFGFVGACWSLLLRPAVRAVFLVPVAWRTFGPARAGHSPMQSSAPPELRAPLRKAG